MGWLESVELGVPSLTTAPQRFGEECLFGGNIPGTAQVPLHRFAACIHRARRRLSNTFPRSTITGPRRTRKETRPQQKRRDSG